MNIKSMHLISLIIRERERKKFTNLKMIKYKKMSKAHFTLHNSFLIS